MRDGLCEGGSGSSRRALTIISGVVPVGTTNWMPPLGCSSENSMNTFKYPLSVKQGKRHYEHNDVKNIYI